MNTQSRILYRSRRNRMVAGVCAGLGDFFGIDPTLVRLFFVIGTILGFGVLLFVYIAMMIVVPEEPLQQPATPEPPAASEESTTQ